jgi:hypothetical protein
VDAGGMYTWSVPRDGSKMLEGQFRLLEQIDAVVELLLPPASNVAPRFVAAPILEPQALTGHLYRGSIADHGHDANSDPLTFLKVSGPAWCGVAPDGTLAGIPGASDVGLNSWVVQLSDGIFLATAELTINVNNAVWDGTSDPVVTSFISDATNVADTAWGTTTVVMPAYGANVSFMSAFSAVNVDGISVGGYRSHSQIRDGSPDAVWVRGGGDQVSNSYATVTGFDATAFAAIDALSAISVEIRAETITDITTFRWFVEAGGNTFVSEEVAELSTVYTTYALDDETAIEWVAFDALTNIANAVGASLGTNSLSEMAFSNVSAVGVYAHATFAAPTAWHGTKIEAFSAVIGLDRYAAWVSGWGLGGIDTLPEADAEPDGLNNLGEYALGGNPTNGSDWGHVPVFGTYGENGTNWVEYVYARRRDAASRGLNYSVETTTNLVSAVWSTNNVTEVDSGIIDSDFESVTNRIPLDAAGFLRLMIELIE